MTQFIAKFAVITGLVVSLTGCAQISLVGDNLWGFTKSAGNFVTEPVIGLLRPAPRQDYVFEQRPHSQNQYAAQHQVKTAFAHDGAAKSRSHLIVPNLNRLPEPQTRNYRQIVRAPSQSYHSPVAKTQRQIVRQARPIVRQAQLQPMPQSQAQNQQEISFVKIGGGSNMSDWVSCQQRAGNYFQMTQTGYRIDPNFESCMRSKGYQPESEAKADLNL